MTLALSRNALRRVDQLAIDEFGIPGVVLMENASRAVADEADALAPGPIVIVCGRGNNGGDGWAAARHLVNRGREVTVLTLGQPRDGSDASINARIARRMSIPERPFAGESLPAAVIVDAIFGTGLDRAPAGEAAAAIDWINDSGAATLAVDVPSGLDCDSGEPLGPTIRARRTVTFVAPKLGFAAPGAAAFTGDVVIADIGAPSSLIERVAGS